MTKRMIRREAERSARHQYPSLTTIETRVGAASLAFFFPARDVGLDAALPYPAVHSRAGAVVPTPASAQMRVLWVSFRKMLPKINVKPATIMG